MQNLGNISGRRQFKALERLCAFPKRGRTNHMILLDEKALREDVRKKNFRGMGGKHNQGEIFNLHCVFCDKNGHDSRTC